MLSHFTAASSPTYVLPSYLTPVLHISLSKQLAVFPHRLLAHWWKTNEACHNDFCQTSGRMLAELGFEITNPGHVFFSDWNNLNNVGRGSYKEHNYVENNFHIKPVLWTKRFLKFFLSADMATRVLHIIQFFEPLWKGTGDPMNIPVKFYQNWPCCLEEYVVWAKCWRTSYNRQRQVMITHSELKRLVVFSPISFEASTIKDFWKHSTSFNSCNFIDKDFSCFVCVFKVVCCKFVVCGTGLKLCL